MSTWVCLHRGNHGPRLEIQAHVSPRRDADSGDEVAIKLAHHRVDPSLLEEEASIYRSLAGKPGFPKVYWFGQQDDFMALVFEFVGTSALFLAAN